MFGKHIKFLLLAAQAVTDMALEMYFSGDAAPADEGQEAEPDPEPQDHYAVKPCTLYLFPEGNDPEMDSCWQVELPLPKFCPDCMDAPSFIQAGIKMAMAIVDEANEAIFGSEDDNDDD